MIYLGSDHAGHELKQALRKRLQDLGQNVRDLGNAALDPEDDYPDYAFAVGEAVAADPTGRGILVCGSAQGVCIAANKVKGVRASAVSSKEDAAKTREHNDANVLCLSGRSLAPDVADGIVDAFLATPFSKEERHARRIRKIRDYEAK